MPGATVPLIPRRTFDSAMFMNYHKFMNTLARRQLLRHRLAPHIGREVPHTSVIERMRSRQAVHAALADAQRAAETSPTKLVSEAVAYVVNVSRGIHLSAEAEHELDAALGKIFRVLITAADADPVVAGTTLWPRDEAVLNLGAVIERLRDPTASSEAPHHNNPASKASPTDALQAARERGLKSAQAEWGRPENLTLKDAAAVAGRSDSAINQDRLDGRAYALVLPDRERGFRYPKWQFAAPPARLAAVLAPFKVAKASCWVIHSFMLRPQEALQGATPADWIAAPAKPIDVVVQLVAARYRDHQGAA